MLSWVILGGLGYSAYRFVITRDNVTHPVSLDGGSSNLATTPGSIATNEAIQNVRNKFGPQLLRTHGTSPDRAMVGTPAGAPATAEQMALAEASGRSPINIQRSVQGGGIAQVAGRRMKLNLVPVQPASVERQDPSYNNMDPLNMDGTTRQEAEADMAASSSSTSATLEMLISMGVIEDKKRLERRTGQFSSRFMNAGREQLKVAERGGQLGFFRDRPDDPRDKLGRLGTGDIARM
jgi:hypothetical protein